MSAVLDNPTRFDTSLLAERYDCISNSQFENGVLLIKELGIKPGDRILDIGCGTGRLGEHVLKTIGKSGYLAGIDPSEHRIKIAQQKVRRFSNISFGLGSDRDLVNIPDNSFDAVYINAVFHHVADKSTALSHINRILKPGGRLGISDPAKEFPSTIRKVTVEVLEIYGHATSLNDELVTADMLRSLIVSAGFRIIKLDNRQSIRHFDTPWHVIEFLEASDFGNYLSHIREDLRLKVKADIAAKLGEYQTEKGVEFTGNTVYAIAEKIAW